MVELQRNFQPNKRKLDGARYVGESMTNNVLLLLIATGSHKRKRLTIHLIPCDPEANDSLVAGFCGARFQLESALR